MKRYKVFLTSSEELAQERKKIAVMISQQNNNWSKDDIYVELVIWEELLQNFQEKSENIRDFFNKEMLKCDIVIVLLYKKVSHFTEETFKHAYENLKKGGKPHFVFAYFKGGNVAIDDIDEDLLKISRLKKEMQKHKQSYGSFDSVEDLKPKLLDQLDQVIIHKQKTLVLDKEAVNKEKTKSELVKYLQYLEHRFRYLDFTGLNAILQKPLPLENIYVKLRARESLPAARFHTIANFERLADGIKGASEIEDEDFAILFERLYHQNQLGLMSLQMLILGQPGSGKTTLMKWIALQCLKENKPFFSQFLPVFISLRELGNDPDHTFRKKSIIMLFDEQMEKENISKESFFDRYFKTNRILFLLDGLDEIGDENIRREVIEWIQNQYVGLNTLIITSRFSGLWEAEGLKFQEEIPVFAIQDFKLEDVEVFLHNWYCNIEIAVAGDRSTQKAIEEGEKKYRDLIKIIKDERYKSLQALAVNPLLLTIIAIVHRTRALLPRERYKLYEECLKVMVELWNLSNRKIDISFSFEDSMIYLSKIALRLMESEQSEISKKEIMMYCLPARIEGQSGDFFLKEMVLKAGLLYESEGRCGFLHPTFQEYLAAWYFSRSKKQNAILLYWDRDYWSETYKLFASLGNAELFYDEIIRDLLEKAYWKRMKLWEDCFEGIVGEEIQKQIELQFARRITEIFIKLEMNENNETLIEALFLHYPLYKHGNHLVREGWHLFSKAPHPFVQSVGASILNRVNENTQTGTELMEQLAERLEYCEKHTHTDTSDRESHYSLYCHNNSFVLLFAGLGSITAFHYALTKLKSGNGHLQYLALVALRDIVAIPSILDYHDLQSLRGILGFLDLRNLRDIPGLLDLQNLRDPRGFRDLMDILHLKGLKKLQQLRKLLIAFDLPKLRSFLGLLELQEQQQHHYLKNFLRNYSKNKTNLERNQEEIAEWSQQAIEKLHSMSDKELLEYFPNTTEKELKQYRDIDIERIASELSKGNSHILQGKVLTKERQKKIETLVTFNFKTVERLLNFDLGILYEEEKYGYYFKAFEILRNKDYHQLREFIAQFSASYPDNRIRANALYILKNLL
jgi:TolA-binding protein